MDSAHFLVPPETSAKNALNIFPPARHDDMEAAPKGTWFDETVDFINPLGNTFMQKILDLVQSVETRRRKRRVRDEIFFRLLVRRILANALRGYYFRSPSAIAFFRKADGYKDSPVWVSGAALSRNVDLLVSCGLLTAKCGKFGIAASMYEATGLLCKIAEKCDITARSLTVRVPPDMRVRLRMGNGETALLKYEKTAETEAWATILQDYSRFLTVHSIDINLTQSEEEQWVKRRNEQVASEGVHLTRPELIQTDLYRQFNNGTFQQGGRLYGGWWINTPKVLRGKITIDDSPTVELDFSGCAIRMLYHLRGHDFNGDPYQLETISAFEARRGIPQDHYRGAIKAITQALINDQNGLRPEMIRLPDGLSFYPDFKRREVRMMIQEKHALIADAFGTGAGLHLQHYESNLAMGIIRDLMSRDIVALPIHDSFVVKAEDRTSVGCTMNRLYRNMFGFYPTIKLS